MTCYLEWIMCLLLRLRSFRLTIFWILWIIRVKDVVNYPKYITLKECGVWDQSDKRCSTPSFAKSGAVTNIHHWNLNTAHSRIITFRAARTHILHEFKHEDRHCLADSNKSSSDLGHPQGKPP